MNPQLLYGRTVNFYFCGFFANCPYIGCMLKTSFPRLQSFAAARLAPDGTFGLHLTVGIALMVLAAWVFGEIAEDVVAGARITVLDLQLARWFHFHASAGLTRFMLLLAYWHSVAGTLVMAALIGAWWRRRHERDWLLALAAAVPGGLVLNVLLKYAFHRARPHFDDPLLVLPTYSFPSGHTVAATLVYGLLACYAVRHVRSMRARVAAVALACLMVGLVGLSRIYLGVHYLSDVLAAAAEGCAWLAVCVTAMSTLRRRRAAGRGA
jgi:undecaprenyl-diphosphatase